MSHRLQVLLDEREHRALKAAARRRGTSMSDYVRDVLRASWSDEPGSAVEAKLAVVREAATHAYPTADPEEIEAQIRAGVAQELE
jgi:plasmid stability protein